MLAATMNLCLSRTEGDLRAVRCVMIPGWILRNKIVSALFCHRLRSIAADLSMDVMTILDLSRMVEELGPEQIDENGALARRFSSMIDGVKRVQQSAKTLEQRAAREKVAAAAALLAAVCADYHQALSRLAWAVAEHDATHAPRLSGFIAESADEVEAMLDRIAFG